ncbi:hypothetical protein AAFF_G00275580 [Aldrovandia affinis]|uniref:Lipoprotein lipase n=1 Tax=Aldrovandia affinis TaxID=143900 RepID=A0AAD7RAP0_9TELE|nr:hypothetical protein AAFF_G00275580 [Aldrovandia affinis]
MGKEIIWMLIISIYSVKTSATIPTTTEGASFNNSTDWIEDYSDVESKFSLRTAQVPDEDLCYLVPGQPRTIAECEFKPDAQTFVIIHGWTVTGMYESWLPKLVTALFEREPSANVVVVDWLGRAQQHYPTSAADTRLVGRDVAKFIDWIEAELDYPWEKFHLLGYSLGAHVAGVAGLLSKNKIYRITGLDPAGPGFEHADAQTTLFGIQRPVGHVDIYPNGGDAQPGCDFRSTLLMIAKSGIYNMDQLLKCSHERSVHLFIDSLVNAERQSLAFRCSSKEAFNRGLCLSCRGNRCTKLGYDAHPCAPPRSLTMYLRTREAMPYKVFHYQVKVHLFCQEEVTLRDQPLKVSLYGTLGDKEDIRIILPIMQSNSTMSFLVTSDVAVGDLLRVELQWEKDYVYKFWERSSNTEFRVRRLRIKAGETQARVIFVPRDGEFAALSRGAGYFTFIRSTEDEEGRKQERLHRLRRTGSLFRQSGAA